MIILDFLYYFLSHWFEIHRERLKWSTPVQRASYAIGIGTLGFLYSVLLIVQLTIDKYRSLHVPTWILVLLILGIIQLYDYVYITKDRYGYITSEKFSKFNNIDKTRGTIISISFILLMIALPITIAVIFIQPDGI